jgi:S-adenosylmethionine:tRNA ribosyltransferase-isomerase
MQISDFDYDLPDELIAQQPTASRRDSRLLSVDGHDGSLKDLMFHDLPSLLQAGDLLVFNDTRVMKARLWGRKSTGGRVELLIERVLEPDLCLAHVRASKSPKSGASLLIGDTEPEVLEVVGRRGDLFELRLQGGDVHGLMERYGHMPLPPYIARPDQQQDLERYQTVYARHAGAVAAPTAGLHFDDEMLAQLRAMEIGMEHITLHVGAGTFQPVRVENLDQHVMHEESVAVSEAVCDRVRETRRLGGRVVAVGTTSVRALESASREGEIRPYRGDTRLFIRPGYAFRSVDALITNFHLPRSTLLMLVSAFAGYTHVMQAYRHAVAEGYRFFSYGDAMFLSGSHTA